MNRVYEPTCLSLTAEQRLRGAKTIVLPAIGACAILFVGAAAASIRSPSPPLLEHAPRVLAHDRAVLAPMTSTYVTPPVVALPVAKPAPKPQHRKHAVETGTIRTFQATRAVLVDGKPMGIAGDPITVSCGRHRVQIGTDPATPIVVPCNGAITVGAPSR